MYQTSPGIQDDHDIWNSFRKLPARDEKYSESPDSLPLRSEWQVPSLLPKEVCRSVHEASSSLQPHPEHQSVQRRKKEFFQILCPLVQQRKET